MNVRQLRNFSYYASLYTHILSKEGAVVECGVGKGRTFLYFSFLASQEKNRNLWGFDSFEGFPEPAKEDASVRSPKKGEWSGVSVNDIHNTLLTAGISKDFIAKNTHLVKGFFSDSLANYPGDPIALLHIDGDLYESYKDVLTKLYPFVISGGLILFDEYNTEAWPGATKAVQEYFKDEVKNICFDSGSGKYYFVKP
jgi:hypothetical protein